jgi:hypothetical protein
MRAGISASVVAVLTVVCGLLPLFAQAGQAANSGANAAVETDIRILREGVREEATSMRFSSGILLIVSLFVLSCARPPITRITVKVPETLSGYLRLRTCVPGTEDPAVFDDEMPLSYSPVCPPGDVEILVIKPAKTFVITSENVRVRRGSDGAALSISTEIPSQ